MSKSDNIAENKTILIEDLEKPEEENINQPLQEVRYESHEVKQTRSDDKEKEDELKEEEKNFDGVIVFCRICEDFIAHSVTTPCEHTFCELCLDQYMLYTDQCPQCSTRIRHQKFSNNILLDNLIKDYIKKYEPGEFDIYQERIQKFKTHQRQKKLSNFDAGMKVDVRDSDYVWCTGRILRTVNKFQDKKVKWMIVKYDKSNKKEEFPENSTRIAPLGFYTSRKDIPRYHRGKLVLQNQQENVIYSLPNYYEEEEEKQQE